MTEAQRDLLECLNGKNWLRAVIYSKRRGLQTTAPISIHDAVAFATELMKQAMLADGHDESELQEMAWVSKSKTMTRN